MGETGIAAGFLDRSMMIGIGERWWAAWMRSVYRGWTVVWRPSDGGLMELDLEKGESRMVGQVVNQQLMVGEGIGR